MRDDARRAVHSPTYHCMLYGLRLEELVVANTLRVSGITVASARFVEPRKVAEYHCETDQRGITRCQALT